MPDFELKDKLVLVTGAGSGIGRGICAVMAAEGALVMASDINLPSAQETVAALPDPEKHLPIEMDVTKKSSVLEAFELVKKKYSKPPSLLVNNAGVQVYKPFHEYTEQDFHNTVNVHLTGTFLVSQTFFIEYKRANLTSGSIVNVGSVNGCGGFANISIYSSAKAAIETFSKTLSVELASSGVRVNCVRPGPIDTPLQKTVTQKFLDDIISQTPLRRFGQVEEVGDLVAFLLGAKSSYITGSSIAITGGFGAA